MKVKLGAEFRKLLARLKSLSTATQVQVSSEKIGGNQVLRLAAANDGRTVFLYDTSSSIKGSGNFMCDIDVLNGILNRRKTIFLTLQDSEVAFAEEGTKYSGTFAVVPTSEIVLDRPEATSHLPVTVQKAIKDALPRISITDVHTGEIIYVICEADKRGITLATNDGVHLAVYEDPEVVTKKPFKFVLPLAMLDTISSVSDDKTTLDFLESTVYVKSSTFELSLPLVSPETLTPLSDIRGLMDQCSGKGTKVSLDIEDMMATIENIIPLCEVGSEIVCKVTKTDLSLSVTTGYGKVKDTLAVKASAAKEVEFRMDPSVFRDTFALIKEKTVHLYIVPGSMMYVRSGKTFYSSYLIG